MQFTSKMKIFRKKFEVYCKYFKKYRIILFGGCGITQRTAQQPECRPRSCTGECYLSGVVTPIPFQAHLIYVGQVGNQEIDFVCHNGQNYEYYQVALSVMEPATLQRELAPLKALKDHYPKFLITLDPQPPIDHDGIRQLYAVDWLLSK